MISTDNHLYKRSLLTALTSISLFFTHICAAQQQKTPPNATQTIRKNNPESPQAPHNSSTEKSGEPIIRNIIISGSTMVPDSVILSRIPYKKGERFDSTKTKTLIHNLYYDLKRFRNISVMGEHTPNNQIDLHIVVEEKTPLTKVQYKGNNALSDKDIEKKIDFSDLPAIDKEELLPFAEKLKKLYQGKNFHSVQVTPELKVDDNGKGIALFNIKEGNKSMVKRVRFIGNEHISGKELRSKIFTREDWPLSFLDGSGSYQPERLEGDRHIIEQFYQSCGYMMAKVTDVDIKKDEKTGHFDVTFSIQEGDLFTFGAIKTMGHDILKEDYLASRLPVQEGKLYSRELIVETIKALETLWGEFGYIYTHVDPSIQPNEENKTVNITFHTELGNKVFLNKINIIGNRKTRDKVIRRKLMLSEGQLLTNSRMDSSKHNVESLGFFEQRDGVNWRKTRVDDEHADLDLILKEAKTGHANLKLGFGGAGANLQSPGSGFSVGAEIADTNLFGSGIQLMLNTSWAKEEQSIMFNVTDPWLFDLPILGAIDVYHKRPSYDEFRHTRAVNEQLTGGSGSLGFVSRWLKETQVVFRFGLDKIKYDRAPIARVYDTCLEDRLRATAEYQGVLDKLFEPGKYVWLATHFGMDRKNHPMHPSRGYKWLAIAHFGFPTFDCNVGFSKFDLDMSWYTPLIGERDLVLKVHGYFGVIAPFSNKNVPYRELFHIGGPASVRGFLFGQAGPNFLGDSIGAKKALFVSTELAFPITQDFNMKGVIFYDGGCGWDCPHACDVSNDFLLSNSFNYRHTVGVGIRILNPMPIRIDWGFKLDHNKKLNESPSEIHFSMTYDF